MARRSSSSRWSRPATGKQIAALKAHGNYDGKYYSVGRASQAIGGSSTRGRRSSGGSSGGSSYSASASSGPMGSGLLSRLYGSADNLDSLLQPALGAAPRSPLASSGSGPTSLLSQLLDVPDDLDSLVRLAMGEDDRATSGSPSGDDPVESVSFTVRTDNSPFLRAAHRRGSRGGPGLRLRRQAVPSGPASSETLSRARGLQQTGPSRPLLRDRRLDIGQPGPRCWSARQKSLLSRCESTGVTPRTSSTPGLTLG